MPDPKKQPLMTFVNAAKEAITHPMGTANLVSGFSTLARAEAASVTPAQMQAIFPDLRKYSEEQIRGFVGIGKDLSSGATVIPSTAFEEPKGYIKPAGG